MKTRRNIWSGSLVLAAVVCLAGLFGVKDKQAQMPAMQGRWYLEICPEESENYRPCDVMVMHFDPAEDGRGTWSGGLKTKGATGMVGHYQFSGKKFKLERYVSGREPLTMIEGPWSEEKDGNELDITNIMRNNQEELLLREKQTPATSS
jgi:hypothetical protein